MESLLPPLIGPAVGGVLALVLIWRTIPALQAKMTEALTIIQGKHTEAIALMQDKQVEQIKAIEQAHLEQVNNLIDAFREDMQQQSKHVEKIVGRLEAVEGGIQSIREQLGSPHKR
jgi:gas vesicle protein